MIALIKKPRHSRARGNPCNSARKKQSSAGRFRIPGATAWPRNDEVEMKRWIFRSGHE